MLRLLITAVLTLTFVAPVFAATETQKPNQPQPEQPTKPPTHRGGGRR